MPFANWAEQEMVEGYMDGRQADAPSPSSNRSRSYCHGFQSGRDDLARKPSAPYAERLSQAYFAIQMDMSELGPDR